MGYMTTGEGGFETRINPLVTNRSETTLVTEVISGSVPASVADIAIDATSSTAAVGTGSATWAHTIGSGSNRVLVVTVGTSYYTHTITGVTYNTVAMTKVFEKGEDSYVGNSYTSGWILKEASLPTTGSYNIVATSSNAGAYVFGAASSWTGVNQTTPNRTGVTAIQNNTAVSVTDAATVSGDIVIDGCHILTSDVTATIGDNQHVIANTILNGAVLLISSYQHGADGGVMSWSLDGAVSWATGAVSLIPAS